MELDANGALYGGKHGVGVWIFWGDNVMGDVGGGVAFLVGIMCEPSGAWRRAVVAREKLSSMRCMSKRNDLDAARSRDRACCR
jgi:hypothetical protein